MPSLPVTYTLNIVGVNPIGNNTWQLEFNPNDTTLTTDFLTLPVTYSNTTSPVILNPFLNNIQGFQNSDYNAIINNSTGERISEYYQQIDYTTAQTIPVNFEQIISGTATPAAIQDSNYTSYQYSGIRYWGSKNTTDNFNTASISQSQVVQTTQNSDIGITTLGYPSVNNWDASILEFNWGGGTYPEIFGGGALSLNQSLLVGADKDAIGKFSTTEPGFIEAVSLTFPINSLPIFNQYTTNAITTNGAKVLGYEFSVPSVSSYMIFSGQGSDYSGQTSLNSLSFTNSASLVTTNTSGYYITGSGVSREEMLTVISSSLNQGDRWFVSLYRALPSTVQGTLEPINSGSYGNYTLKNSEGGYLYPLTKNGVYEITSTGAITLNVTPTIPVNIGSTFGGTNINNLGLLIWKAQPGPFILFNDATLSGVGKGGLVTSNPNPVIQQNFTYITQNFGNNPKNQ